MCDRIIYIQCNLSSVPWQGSAAVAATAASPSPTPGYHHVLYKGRGETQVSWHGETYCLVGAYRCYGDAPIPTPEKMEVEKPVSRRAPKRPSTNSFSDEELGCPPAKIQRLQPSPKKETPQKRAGRATARRKTRR
ncbi:DPEP2 neighbor protein-like [Manis pentadactyla]|uniref:DPEP2 neighbor protein-like n=1 Tax=Manis pentadactyla TaxID=143292 RepID=UPI00255CF094|nr:DPEP2 neighbor protein-like [Manis pentadactyla]